MAAVTPGRVELARAVDIGSAYGPAGGIGVLHRPKALRGATSRVYSAIGLVHKCCLKIPDSIDERLVNNPIYRE
jgi:hypothetical protein